jgi:methylthioribose-1-phosphate isomerase
LVNWLRKKEKGYMQIGDKYYRSIWFNDKEPEKVFVIDQEKLHFSLEIRELRSVEEVYNAIKNMTVRGAPAIGAAGAFGMYLSTLHIPRGYSVAEHLEKTAAYLISCRPTAVNLSWAVRKVVEQCASGTGENSLSETALLAAKEIYENEIQNCKQIGINGLHLIEDLSIKKNGLPVNILTHCNAGWLACIDYGTALAPVYAAHEKGIPLHVWIDETRPRNQGARLTAYELENCGIPCSLISDNTGGHLMQHGMVDIVLTGSDRTTKRGDVANKIGTYLKALAAFDNKVPFYVALPSSSIDFTISDGISEIQVEEREPEEVSLVTGFADNKIMSIRICPEKTRAVNFGFDITPARLITGLITEKGICRASENAILKMFSDKLN